MVLCFFISINATVTTAAASSDLMQGQYKNKPIFYRKNPPPPIVASAKTEKKAQIYIEKLKIVPETLASPTSIGKFSITGNKSEDGGQLVVFSTDTGSSIKRYKAFINDRAAIGNIKPTDLRYFADLFDNRDNDKVVKWPSTSASAATAKPQATAEEKQAQIRNLKQEVEAIKQTIQAIRLVSGSQSYVASIQQQKDLASSLRIDNVEQTPEALAAAKEILERIHATIIEMNETETNSLVIVKKKFRS